MIREFLNEKLPFYNSFKKKSGFTVPINIWLPRKQKEILKILPKVKCIEHYFPSQGVIKLCKNLKNNNKVIIAVWRLLFFALWHTSNVEKKNINGNVFDVLADST